MNVTYSILNTIHTYILYIKMCVCLNIYSGLREGQQAQRGTILERDRRLREGQKAPRDGGRREGRSRRGQS